MFRSPNPRKIFSPHRTFGQDFTAFLPVIQSAISVGGSIGSALIASSTAKSIASTQAETELAKASVQERIAQLQLQAIQSGAASTVGQTASGGMFTTSLGAGTVAGIPTWILLIGGVVIILLIKK